MLGFVRWSWRDHLFNGLSGWLVALVVALASAGGTAWWQLRDSGEVTIPVEGRSVPAHDPSLPAATADGPFGAPSGVRLKPAVVTYDVAEPLLWQVAPSADDVRAVAFGAVVEEGDDLHGLVFDTELAATPCDGAFVGPAPRLREPGRWWRLADRTGDREVAVQVVQFERTGKAHDFVTELGKAGRHCGYTTGAAAARPGFEETVSLTWHEGDRQRELLVLRSANVVVQIGVRLAASEHRTLTARLGDIAARNWADVLQHDRDDGSEDHRIGF